jgi:RHS repeat-associated protein
VARRPSPFADGGISFVHNDHLATPQVMTDGAAAVVWDASYRPFGEATIAGAAANDQRFPGQTADAETGYHDNWYRTYDPSLGRYLQSDPIGIMAGFNTYAYVGGNPVMYADPTGELALIPVFLVLADATGLGLTLYASAITVCGGTTITAPVAVRISGAPGRKSRRWTSPSCWRARSRRPANGPSTPPGARRYQV